MNNATLADVVGVAHGLFVLFVLAGQMLVLAGWSLDWVWTRNRTFRMSHLGAILTVVAIDFSGRLCPLTTLEWQLRQQAGEAPREAGFIEHWVQTLLYYDWPGWVFSGVYAAFALLVAVSYWRYPPLKR